MVADTALTVRESQPPVIVPRNLQEMIDIAERLAKSSLLPEALRGKVPEVLMQIMAGQELGLYSMASLRSFNIIQGKPVMGSDAMVAVVLGSGKAEYFRRVGEGTDKSVTYETKRRGQEAQRCTWTIEMAKAAALHQKDNWRTFPRAMLASRAKSELARDVYPDVLAGCYSTDEVGDTTTAVRDAVRNEEATQAVDAEFTETTVDAPEVLAIDDMQTVEALKAQGLLVAQLKLTGSAAERANGRYKARMAWLKTQLTVAAPAPEPAA